MDFKSLNMNLNQKEKDFHLNPSQRAEIQLSPGAQCVASLLRIGWQR
jgi:hypothetical protein